MIGVIIIKKIKIKNAPNIQNTPTIKSVSQIGWANIQPKIGLRIINTTSICKWSCTKENLIALKCNEKHDILTNRCPNCYQI
jgi:hypothetical protein